MSQIGVHPLTHVHAHWLDLFITQSTCNTSKTMSHTEGLPAPHTVAAIDLWLQVGSRPERTVIKLCPINKINTDALREDLTNSSLLIHPMSTLRELLFSSMNS